jgi:metal-dependent amidase/aminoacylase/carboxypeptidase family protein
MLVNDEATAARVREALVGAVGAQRVHPTAPSLASEDFAVYLAQRPGAMFLLGVQTPDASGHALHCMGFHAPDEALAVGVRCFAAIAARALGASS